MTKRDLQTIEWNYKRYINSTAETIEQAYKKPSGSKKMAFNDIWWMCRQMHGWGLKVISHTAQFFTAGFQYCDPENGNIRFRYITKSRILDADLPICGMCD